jgi:hypothetical protein
MNNMTDCEQRQFHEDVYNVWINFLTLSIQREQGEVRPETFFEIKTPELRSKWLMHLQPKKFDWKEGF